MSMTMMTRKAAQVGVATAHDPRWAQVAARDRAADGLF